MLKDLGSRHISGSGAIIFRDLGRSGITDPKTPQELDVEGIQVKKKDNVNLLCKTPPPKKATL